jgi:hypothetical protein
LSDIAVRPRSYAVVQQRSYASVDNKALPDIHIDSIRLDYSLATLRHHKIRQIVIAGLELNAKVTDGKLILPDYIKNLRYNSPEQSKKITPNAPPFSFDEILISNAVLNITKDGQSIRIPWNLKLTPATNNNYKAEVEITQAKQQLRATALLDLKNKLIKLTANITNNGRQIALQTADIDLAIKQDKEGNFTATGKSVIKFGGPINNKLSIKPLALSLAFNGNYQKNGHWQFGLSNSKGERFDSAQRSVVAINDVGNAREFSSSIKQITVHGSGDSGNFSLRYNLAFTGTKFNDRDTLLKLDNLQISGETNQQSSQILTKFTGAGHFNDLSIAQIAGTLPLRWPYQAAPPGTVKISGVRWQDLELGKASFDLSQDKNGFNFNGNYDSALLKGLSLVINGGVDFSSPLAAANFHFKTQPRRFNNLELGHFNPKLVGYAIDTDLELSGGGSYKANIFKANLNTALHNINLRGQNDFNLQGGELSLTFPEPQLKSLPGYFSFKQISFGDISIKDGLLEFQIESPDSILLEKSSARWCNGHIYTQAMRFSPKVQDYDLTIYCDRLNVAQLLEQFGAATAEGEGRVTGKIPIKISDGRFIPQDGFLYSTPGEGGTIKLRDTQRLTAGITPGTPQFAQVDLAREALKDFSYKWTSIDLSGQGDDLLMHLQIDGKPASPLPFVYKKEFGGFVRVDAKSPGSHFQGIKLDVNFKLPLNQILYYGNSIKQLTN